MKVLGIVGGLGPESTVDYYRAIISLYRETVAEDSYPRIIIDSLDVSKGIRLVEAQDWEQLTQYLLASVQALADAGADFALMAANTPHVVFSRMVPNSALPLISIVESACREVQRLGFTKVGLLGTGFTMGGTFYPEVFDRAGIAVVPPSEAERTYVHDKYLNELVRGVFKPEVRDRILHIIASQKERDGIEAVILAGTELPLLLRQESLDGMPLLDTTRIHVAAAVQTIIDD
jgi:aspartate racemase